ncbi:hypothetical protein C8R42DRAFT_157915 [Lentinula raphanica]|nr:hypothetical protein C8R42DRAFT_157915 [Lentinula raphanica]
MSRENGLPVSDDIIDRILLFSPTFSSLKAAILICKQFHRVFQSHPNSVVRAVAYNITGPALPQALACIRHPDVQTHDREFPPRVSWSDADEDSDDESTISNHKEARNTPRRQADVQTHTEELGDLSSAPIAPSETHQIIANSKIVARLEDMFSFRYIDRTASTSQLSPSDSRAFHVAVYHLMLYNAVTHLDSWVIDLTDDNANAEEHRKQLEKGKKSFSPLSTSELLQLYSVAEFLKEILSWCVRTSGYPSEICDLVLVVGPERILKCFDNQEIGSLEPLEDLLDFLEEELELIAGLSYSSSPHMQILESRNIEIPSDSNRWLSISSRVSERNSQCDSCRKSFGFGAHSRSTFVEISHGECLRLHTTSLRSYEPQHIHRYLLNNLRYNNLETESLCKEAKKFGPSLLLQIWNDLWNLNIAQQPSQNVGQPSIPPSSDWTEDSYLCETCFTSFLRENLWVWWRHIKASSETLKENCWYGYNCRTQTHSIAHASKLNHLCEQTRF